MKFNFRPKSFIAGVFIGLGFVSAGFAYACQTPTPTPDCWGSDSCVSTPTPTPTPVPSVTPLPSNGGGGSQPVIYGPGSSTQAPSAPTCNIAFNAPILQGFKANGGGSVTYSWWPVNGVSKYSIVYGYQPNQLVYGEDNIPSTSTSITLNGLQPGKNVWAIVAAWKNGCAENSNLLDPVVQ